MKRPLAIAALALLVAAIGAYWLWRPSAPPSSLAANRAAGAGGRPPVHVAAARAQNQSWQSRVAAVGTVQAIQSVQVTTEIGGIVESIHFESGDTVRQGILLVQLDITADRARLANFVAQLEQARVDLARSRRLLAGGAAAKADVEQAATAVDRLAAQAAEQRALMAKKSLRAPFTGAIGIRLVNLGQFLAPGQGIASLQTIAPIHVNFALPEIHYSAIRPGLPIEIRVDAYAKQSFEGKVAAVNPEINQETRNFIVQGLLSNSARRLRPGMFAEVTVIVPQSRSVVTVPATAISYNPYGDAVYRIDQRAAQPPTAAPTAQGPPSWWDKLKRFFRGTAETPPGQPPKSVAAPPVYTAVRTFVTVGERRGSEVAIEKGLTPGDLVVTAGQLKLDDGAPVIIADPENVPKLPSIQSRQ